MKTILSAIFLFGIFSLSSAQDDWGAALPYPTSCYSEKDDYSKKLDEARSELKSKIELQKKALQQKADAMTDEQKMKVAMQYVNMSPNDIIKMQNEQLEMVEKQQAVSEKGADILNRFNDIQEKFNSEMKTRLDPITEEYRKLPDGEGTPDWAIKKGKELMEKFNAEYEEICAKYLTGNNALFKSWLADYKTYLVNDEIPFMRYQAIIAYRQFGITPDEKASEMEGILKYFEKCRDIFGLRKPYRQG